MRNDPLWILWIFKFKHSKQHKNWKPHQSARHIWQLTHRYEISHQNDKDLDRNKERALFRNPLQTLLHLGEVARSVLTSRIPGTFPWCTNCSGSVCKAVRLIRNSVRFTLKDHFPLLMRDLRFRVITDCQTIAISPSQVCFWLYPLLPTTSVDSNWTRSDQIDWASFIRLSNLRHLVWQRSFSHRWFDQ